MNFPWFNWRQCLEFGDFSALALSIGHRANHVVIGTTLVNKSAVWKNTVSSCQKTGGGQLCQVSGQIVE